MFHILKFRTMYEDEQSYAGPKVTAEDDPRVTPIGRWLRSAKINELPQLWNVLKGEMSFVGPRPEDPDIAANWTPEVRAEIFSVRPGITSPASVLYRNEETLLNTGQVMETYLNSILPSKLRLDQLYVRHRSFLLDMDILFWTSLVLLPKLGSYAPPEESLFWGPFSRFVRRYVSWFLIDALVTFLAMGAAGYFWRSLGPLHVGMPLVIWIALGFAVIFSLTGAIAGTNRISWSSTGAVDVFDLLLPVGFATLAALLVSHAIGHPLQPGPLLPNSLVLLASGLAFTGFVVVRYRSRLVAALAMRWLSARGEALAAKERVLIVGGGEAGQFISWLLHNGKQASAFHVTGFVDDDLYKQGTRILGVEVLGRRADIPTLVAKHDIGIIIFAIHNISRGERKQVLEICAGTPARVVVMPNIGGLLKAALHLHSVDHSGGRAAPTPARSGPNELHLSPISAEDLDLYLARLEAAALNDDTQAVLEQVRLLRREVESASYRQATIPLASVPSNGDGARPKN